MANLLGYLTGRTEFVTPGWSATTVGNTYPVITSLRKYLGLDVSTSDWRTAAVMALLEQDQRLESMLPGFDASYCSSSKLGRLNFMGSTWQRPDDVWVGGYLGPDTTGPPMLLHEPDAWPAGDFWTLAKYNDNNATLSVSHNNWLVPAYADGDKLRVQWPEGSGWRGDIVLTSDWEQVTVQHVPVYPVDAVAAGLELRTEVPLILQQTGLHNAWVISNNSSEKVSTVAAAISIMSAQ